LNFNQVTTATFSSNVILAVEDQFFKVRFEKFSQFFEGATLPVSRTCITNVSVAVKPFESVQVTVTL